MYFIDDSNTTIQYFTGSKPWNPKSPLSTGNLADVTKCYNQTYTVNNQDYLCSQSDACHFQIPFRGSGITIYVIQSYYALNTTVTLDGNTSTIASIANLPRPADLAYNITLYDVQSLPVADHTLDVALVGYTLSNGTTTGSLIRFDAAAVNDTSPSAVSPSPSGAGNGTPTAIAPAPSGGASHPNSMTAYIVGGAFGGLAVIAAIIFALFYCRRRKPSEDLDDAYTVPTRTNFEVTPLMFDPASAIYSPHSPPPPQPFTYATTSMSSFPVTASNDWHTRPYPPSQSSAPSSSAPSSSAPSSSAPSHSVASASVSAPRGSTLYASTAPTTATHPFMVANPEPGASSIAPQTYTAQQSKNPKASYVATSSAPVVTASLPPTPSGRKELTEDQAAFVDNLRSLNVPAAEIARLMEVMRREREAGSSTGVSQGNAMSEPDAPPPSYDYKSPT